ncbi:hypothetical protein J4435_05280 [Candidatus Woesearchaeota archaeon]|nr:hypothetical protein [Candidatus Woesearchaeota archaeon]
MKLWLHKVEHIVDRLIPFSLILLFLLVVGEIFYYDALQPYYLITDIVDYAIIILFVIDLAFKYARIHSIPRFFRECWLEIIALLPVFIVVRVFEFFAPLARLDVVSDAAHSILETEAKWGLLVQEAERTGQVSRVAMLQRFIRPLARLPRFVKAFTFYERPTGKHHPHE